MILTINKLRDYKLILETESLFPDVGIKTKAIAIYAIRGDRVLSSNLIVIGSEESST